MRPAIAACGMLALCMAGAAYSNSPPAKESKPKPTATNPPPAKSAKVKPAAGKTTPAKDSQAKPVVAKPRPDSEAEALARAQDRAVENYRQNQRRAAALAKQQAAKAAAVRQQAAERRSRAIVISPEEEARRQAEALARAQDRAVANYRRNMGLPVAEAPVKPAVRREKLACYTGTEERHARIGVEVVNDQVTYFAYYSKWEPRTCSIEARRDGPYSRWTDNGAISTVRLVDDKGTLRIERKGNSFRFAFVDVDRMRYCGMDGKINGSLVVTRGKRSCDLQGVMDGHS
jgi:hypothetical protein